MRGRKRRREGFVGQYEQTLRRWAPSVGIDPDRAVWVESLLNPMNFPWKDLQNMKARVQDYIENQDKESENTTPKTPKT